MMALEAVRDQLEDGAVKQLGSSSRGWTHTLRPVEHALVTNAVFEGVLLGEHVFAKIFAARRSFKSELRGLRAARQVGVRVPKVILAIDRPKTIVLSRIAGVLLEDTWRRLLQSDRELVCQTLAQVTCHIHRALISEGVDSDPSNEPGETSRQSLQRRILRWSTKSAGYLTDHAFRISDLLLQYTAQLENEEIAVLTHYDLSPRNLIVDWERLTANDTSGLAVIDFEHSALDHECMDYHNTLGPKMIDYDPNLVEQYLAGLSVSIPVHRMANIVQHFQYFRALVSLGTLAYLVSRSRPSSKSAFYDSVLWNLT